jgi:hypothetical protein
MVLGLTRAESRVAISVEGACSRVPDSVSNASRRSSPSPVLSADPSTSAASSPPAAAAYREILAHEMRHLKAYLDYLPKVEEGARALASPLRSASPCTRGAARRARAAAGANSTAAGCPSSRTRWRIEALQAAIDSPQEYARLSKVCRGEVQSLIGSTYEQAHK